MIVMLHVPKTGGTAVKYALSLQPVKNFTISKAHRENLSHIVKRKCKAVIVIRDPLERFCSGFYERKHFHLRYKETLKVSDFPTKFAVDYKKAQFHPEENLILNSASTADEFITFIRECPQDFKNLEFDNYKSVKTPLGILTRPLSFWTGPLDYLKANEAHIENTVDLENLEQYLDNEYKIKMPGYDQPLFRRNKSFYGVDDIAISDINREWFINSFRKSDYDLIGYIRSQTYHWQ